MVTLTAGEVAVGVAAVLALLGAAFGAGARWGRRIGRQGRPCWRGRP